MTTEILKRGVGTQPKYCEGCSAELPTNGWFCRMCGSQFVFAGPTPSLRAKRMSEIAVDVSGRGGLRGDLAEIMSGLPINNLGGGPYDFTFETEVSGINGIATCWCGGFGLPRIFIELIVNRTLVQVGLIESDEYEQDGGDPIQVHGWAWRLLDDMQQRQLFVTGWSDADFETADDALAAAIKGCEGRTRSRRTERTTMKPYHRVGESFVLGLVVLFCVGLWAASCIQ